MKRWYLFASLVLAALILSSRGPRKAPPPVASAPAKAVAHAAFQKRLEVIASTNKDAGVITTQTAQPGENPYAAVFPSMPAMEDFRTYNPEAITVEVEPGFPITYQRVSTYLLHDRRVWVGRNPALPLSIYTAAASEHTYYAVVDLAPGSYGAEIRNGVATTFYNNTPLTCGADNALEQASVLGGNAAPSQPSGTAATPAAAVDGNVIDIDLSLFADEASINLKGYEDMLTQTLAEVETCNQELVNSLITNFRWVLTDFIKVPATVYSFSIDMNADLVKMSGKNPLGDLVKATMANSGSDEAILLVTGGGSWGGLAWVRGSYAMVRYDQLFYRTMAHEMGHNLGSLHDRITQVATASDSKSYNYGYMFDDPMSITLPDGTKKLYTYYVGDIMSYASVRAPYFANPNVRYTFTSNSNQEFATVNLGIDVTQDYPAYCARSISEYAATLAAVGTAKPHISSQPLDTSATPGGTATLTTYGGAGATYQWRKNGVDLAGATSGTLTLPQVSTLDAGAYTCVVTVSGNTLTSKSATVTVTALAEFNPNARLANISTRAQVRSGGAAQIAGFVLSGDKPTNVLVRASGPALGNFQIAGYLQDPTMSLYDCKSVSLTTNDDWDADCVLATAQNLGAFGWTLESKDSATVQTLLCASYTAIISGKDEAQGVALVEVYDAGSEPDAPRLINLSTRSWVASAENTQIAGFALRGDGLKTILIRAAGPALADFGVGDAVVDPVLTLFDSHGAVVIANDNWSDNSNAAEIAACATAVGAFGFKSNSKDAALLITVPPGSYTASVTPQAGTSAGVGLVELYEVK